VSNSFGVNAPGSSEKSGVAQRIDAIRQTVPPSVKLMAVTKQVPIEAMREAYAAGVRDFGESRVQDAMQKQAQLSDLSDLVWHLIGHLQSNKAAKALDMFSWIHSADSLKLVLRLNELAEGRSPKPKLCLQVKLRPDEAKFGWQPEQLWAELPEIDCCTNLDVVGLMVIPPYGLSADETRAVFDEAAKLANTIRQQSWQLIRMTELSMGMSMDYALAVEAGATIIRVGRTLFGDRP
jgi:pyridoxal phosphate enzyme (YggS family)